MLGRLEPVMRVVLVHVRLAFVSTKLWGPLLLKSWGLVARRSSPPGAASTAALVVGVLLSLTGGLFEFRVTVSKVALVAHHAVAVVFEVSALGGLVFGVVDLRALEVVLGVLVVLFLRLVLHVLLLVAVGSVLIFNSHIVRL